MAKFEELLTKKATIDIENEVIQDTYAIFQIEIRYKTDGGVSFNAGAEYDISTQDWKIDINDRGNEYYDWSGQIINSSLQRKFNLQEGLAELVESKKAEWTKVVKKRLQALSINE